MLNAGEPRPLAVFEGSDNVVPQLGLILLDRQNADLALFDCLTRRLIPIAHSVAGRDAAFDFQRLEEFGDVGYPGRVDISVRGRRNPKSRGDMWRVNAVPNPLDSRFRGNDGVKIGNNSAIIASLRPLCLRAFALNSLCQHALVGTVVGLDLSERRAVGGRPRARHVGGLGICRSLCPPSAGLSCRLSPRPALAWLPRPARGSSTLAKWSMMDMDCVFSSMRRLPSRGLTQFKRMSLTLFRCDCPTPGGAGIARSRMSQLCPQPPFSRGRAMWIPAFAGTTGGVSGNNAASERE